MEVKNFDYNIEEETNDKEENIWKVYEMEKRKICQIASGFIEYEIRHKNLVDMLKI